MNMGDGDTRLAQLLKRCRTAEAPTAGGSGPSVTRQRVAPPWPNSTTSNSCSSSSTSSSSSSATGSSGIGCTMTAAAAAAVDIGTTGDDVLLMDLYRAFPTVRPTLNTSMPLLMPRDSGMPLQCQRTLFQGEWVACFLVGGERRLCLTQLLHTRTLRRYSLSDINRACVYLNIQSAPCSREQLDALKILGVLPITYANCSLITQTDAVRMHSFLCLQSKGPCGPKRRAAEKCEKPVNCDTGGSMSSSIPVMHSCFGGCHGRYYVHLYTKPAAECIECDVCGDLFSVETFVSHSHHGFERNICHWGFDSVNWRSYIHLPFKEQSNSHYAAVLQQFKSRFERTDDQLSMKRSHADVQPEESVPKRPHVNGADAFLDVFDYNGLANLAAVVPNIYDAAWLRSYSSAMLFNHNFMRSHPALITAAQVPFLLNSGNFGIGVNRTDLRRDELLCSQSVIGNGTLCNGPSNVHASNGISSSVSEKGSPKEAMNGQQRNFNKKLLSSQFCDDHSQNNSPCADRVHQTSRKEDSIDDLLKRYVSDPVGLQMIRTKMFECLRDAEMKRCCLEIQNRLLLEQVLQEERRRQLVTSSLLPVSGLF